MTAQKNIVLSILLTVIMLTTGCCRIAMEIDHGATVSRGRHIPPNRFYNGTKSAVRMPYLVVELFKLDRHPDVLDYTFLGIVVSLTVCNIPLDIAMDTVLLPLDVVLFGIYQANPPLDTYVHDNNLPELRKKLENGADPNVISSWFQKDMPLIQTAFQENNVEMFELLLKHGAVVPFDVFSSANPDWRNIKMLRAAFDSGLTDGALASPKAKYVISDLIYKHLFFPIRPSSDDKALAELLIMLMDNGFPPIEWNRRVGGRPDTKTPLDVVLLNHAMETEQKNRLTAAMIAHGAKKSSEISQ